MKKAAVVGFGNIGFGVCRLLTQDHERIKKAAPDYAGLKYICDLRSFPDSEYGDKHIKDFDTVCADPEISVVIEVTGARRAAYEMTKKALCAGKSVVTSNKEVVAEYGEELFRIAEENGVYYLFEAAVGGTIPIIRPLRDSVCADRVTAIYGILNGTTNYILTEMSNNGSSYEDALQNAKRLGYAEPDPTADVTGKDAARKIVILAACACGVIVTPDSVKTEGITGVSAEDIYSAEEFGGKIKLIAYYKNSDNGIILGVKPFFVPNEHLLAGIDGVNNGIFVRCENAGDLLFAGKGAGSIPTAAAVVSDVIEAINGKARNFKWKKGDSTEEAPGERVLAVFDGRVDIPQMRTVSYNNSKTKTITDRKTLSKLEKDGVRPVSVYELL